jgi:FkbM family methyltransferase
MKLERHVTKTGIYWLPTDAPEDVIIQNILADDIFEVQVYWEAERYIKPGSTVIDVGPCYGQFSFLFSKLVGDGKVIAIEASPFIYDVFVKNIEENKISNIVAINQAVWDKSGETVKLMDYDFSHYKSYGCFGIDRKQEGKVEVKTMRIDDLEYAQPVSLIKVDAQGADLHVMRGATQTIAQYKPAILFEYEAPYDNLFSVNWKAYEDFIASIGYKIAMRVGDCNFLILPESGT